MEITIIETGGLHELCITDPESGCEWTRDLLGNYGALPEYDDETESYLMSADDFEWWSDIIEKYQAADNRLYEIRSYLDWEKRREFEDFVSTFLNVDLEDYPDALQQALDEWEAEND